MCKLPQGIECPLITPSRCQRSKHFNVPAELPRRSKKIVKRGYLTLNKLILGYSFSRLSQHNGSATWIGYLDGPRSDFDIPTSSAPQSLADAPAPFPAKVPSQIGLKIKGSGIVAPGDQKQQINLMRQEAATVKIAGHDLAIGVSQVKPVFLQNASNNGFYLTLAGILSEAPQVNIVDFLKFARKANLKMRLLLVRKLVDVVRTMHARGVVHLNLTPDCVYVDRDGNLKLTDFEHAQTLQGYVAQPLAGNLSYVPPEHIYVGRVTDPRKQDEWAVAVMAFCLLFQRLPWQKADISNNWFQLYCLNNLEFWRTNFRGDISVSNVNTLRNIFNAALSPVPSRKISLLASKNFGKPLSSQEDSILRQFIKINLVN
jgi:hypothetical protein